MVLRYDVVPRSHQHAAVNSQTDAPMLVCSRSISASSSATVTRSSACGGANSTIGSHCQQLQLLAEHPSLFYGRQARVHHRWPTTALEHLLPRLGGRRTARTAGRWLYAQS